MATGNAIVNLPSSPSIDIFDAMPMGIGSGLITKSSHQLNNFSDIIQGKFIFVGKH